MKKPGQFFVFSVVVCSLHSVLLQIVENQTLSF